MAKNILIALDESPGSMKAVEFVSKIADKNCRITLLSVMQTADLVCELDGSALRGYLSSRYPDYCRMADDHKRKALADALEKAGQLLVNAGFDTAHIARKIQSAKNDVALEIIQEARTGYDLVVLGRRGLSSVKGFLMGSVSQKVLSALKDISVLIVN